jgi:hypothetical protein
MSLIQVSDPRSVEAKEKTNFLVHLSGSSDTSRTSVGHRRMLDTAKPLIEVFMLHIYSDDNCLRSCFMT